ncbi:MAG: GNAT family N-acetyltransferase, partial [Faecalibacillus sp.]
ERHCYIGEVSYHYEEEYREYVLNIIIEYRYRHLGKGKEALLLLCQKAKENGVRFLCDDIDSRNPAIHLFKQVGFKEIWQKGHIIMLKKRL